MMCIGVRRSRVIGWIWRGRARGPSGIWLCLLFKSIQLKRTPVNHLTLKTLSLPITFLILVGITLKKYFYFTYILGTGVYKRDDAAFMFSLVNPAGLPTKMKIKANMTNAICCSSTYGPAFGKNDLRIVNNPNSNNCSYTLGTTYECPAGQSATTFLTGAQQFTVNEIEVFELVMVG